MSKYLIDTNVIVDIIRGKIRVDESIFESGAYISTISLSELYYGAKKSSNVDRSFARIENILDDLDISIVDFTKEMALVYGDIKSDLESKGQRLEDVDLLIAGTALYKKMILATSNIKHFERIKNLEILNPRLLEN